MAQIPRVAVITGASSGIGAPLRSNWRTTATKWSWQGGVKQNCKRRRRIARTVDARYLHRRH